MPGSPEGPRSAGKRPASAPIRPPAADDDGIFEDDGDSNADGALASAPSTAPPPPDRPQTAPPRRVPVALGTHDGQAEQSLKRSFNICPICKMPLCVNEVYEPDRKWVRVQVFRKRGWRRGPGPFYRVLECCHCGRYWSMERDIVQTFVIRLHFDCLGKPGALGRTLIGGHGTGRRRERTGDSVDFKKGQGCSEIRFVTSFTHLLLTTITTCGWMSGVPP